MNPGVAGRGYIDSSSGARKGLAAAESTSQRDSVRNSLTYLVLA